MSIKTNFLGVDVVVEGDYQEAEARTHDYPGCADDFYVNKVTTKNGDDITDFFNIDLFMVHTHIDHTKTPRTVTKTVGSSLMDLLVEECLEKIHDMDEPVGRGNLRSDY